MATTQEILDQAKALGELIAEHDATKKLQAATKKLEGDKDAQESLVSYQRLATQLQQKSMQGLPIEVSEKRELEAIQQAVVHNLTLQEFQIAQMDHSDLVRQIDSALFGDESDQGGDAPAPGGPAGGGSPIVMG